ncbi:Electron transfer flavoprotein alpha subunit [Thermaerobacter marianensis DSM 12885]|uniref:Electron transfer flavoprotein alpha subunit n=1 Tax=Thermaerobacter marianensis (strain ATCC 700841 / DSM 12885 / JCM 10246 / 7p75a) TaxID=644966 RepID=E6SGW7_THEM7|nr:electron transfer flavoprotein subunit alpha/FixB family protein [Thermaerobacter marianensis]ADU50598.1 Electron transfer flavoprotein alpha subunit [Thermaerobacter marianensis DSM 12885]
MILVVQWNGKGLTQGTAELLGGARQLAGDGPVAVAVLGPGAREAAAEAGAYGAEAYAAEGDLESYGGEAYVATLAAACQTLQPQVVLMPADPRGREVAPRLAARLGGAAVTDVIEARRDGDRIVWSRPVFGGKAVADVVLQRAPQVATVRPGSFPAAEKAGSSPAEVRELAVSGTDRPLRRVEVRAEAQGGVRLEEARIVVSGGRGLGGPEPFKDLEELARLLGGAVGASLAAVDEGWAPPERQVGQTGKIIAPDLYIAIGISGASQHLAGIAGAKTVVAINKDPEAPIFEVARLGVPMEYQKVLPHLIEEVRKLKAG